MSTMSRCLLPIRWPVLAALALSSLSLGSQAAIFEDADARRAILDLRQRLEAVQRRQAEDAARATQTQQSNQSSQANSDAAVARLAEDNAQLRRSLLDLSNQIEQLRTELSRQTGQKEMALREVAELQRRLRDLPTGIDEQRLREVAMGLEARLRRLEPTKVSLDGREFLAEPAEIRDFDAALAVIRRSEFVRAEAVFTSFLQRHPTSGYAPSALFWLGSAQYANRSYKEALASLSNMLRIAPTHPRAPEAMLSIANAQIELKEPSPVVRKILEDLIKAYPQSEAAAAAKEELARLK